MQQHAAGARPIDDTLYRLLRLASLIQRPLTPASNDHPELSLNEWRLIVVMADRSGQSVQDLSRATGLDKMNVSRAVRRLMAVEILSRTPDDMDRRRIRHDLTTHGWQLYRQIRPGAERVIAGLLQDLTDDEQSALSGVLDRLESRAGFRANPGRGFEPVSPGPGAGLPRP